MLPDSVCGNRGPRISGRPHMHFPYSGLLGIIDQRYVYRTWSTAVGGRGLPTRARYRSS